MTKMHRQSNFELLRIICMLMVMAGHAIGYVQETDLFGIDGICKLTVSQLCLVCVNVFVMISGWFGIKASWRGIGALLFQVFFISGLCFLVFFLLGQPVSFKDHLLPYLLFGKGYWFVVSYLILYALSPVLNAFCEKATQRVFLKVLLIIFIAEFVFGFLLDTGHYAYGFSPLAFISLYLLARYVRMYPGKVFSFKRGYDLLIYLGISILSIAGLWLGYKWFGMGFHLNHYDSPLAIAASLFFLLFFSKLQFQSKAINWLASSAFAIYLIHENCLISPYYREGFRSLHDSLPLGLFYPSMFGLLVLIGLACILIDKPRQWIWNLMSK